MFLKCFRVNALKPCGSSVWLGAVNTGAFPIPSPRRPIPIPSRRFRGDCLRPMRRRLSIPHAVIRLHASRFSPRLSDTIDGAEVAGRHTACPTWRAVSSWLSCVRAAAYPMRASDRSPPCRHPYHRRSPVPFPHGFADRPFLSCSHFNIAPPIDTRDGERSGADACSALRIG